MLRHADADTLSGGPNHAAGEHQLQGRDVVQQDRPRNRQFDIQAGRQFAIGFQQKAAARYINGDASSGIQYTAAADEFPTHIERNIIAPVRSPFAADLVAFVPFRLACPEWVHSFSSYLVRETSSVCGPRN